MPIRQMMTPLSTSSAASFGNMAGAIWTQYMKQQPKFVQGHLNVARSLGSGESLVSFDNTVSSTLDVQQREGGKVALAGPTDDFLPVFFTAEAILKDAPHPNAAKLYVTWFLSKEWQTRTGVYSSRRMFQRLPDYCRFRTIA